MTSPRGWWKPTSTIVQVSLALNQGMILSYHLVYSGVGQETRRVTRRICCSTEMWSPFKLTTTFSHSNSTLVKTGSDLNAIICQNTPSGFECAICMDGWNIGWQTAAEAPSLGFYYRSIFPQWHDDFIYFLLRPTDTWGGLFLSLSLSGENGSIVQLAAPRGGFLPSLCWCVQNTLRAWINQYGYCLCVAFL